MKKNYLAAFTIFCIFSSLHAFSQTVQKDSVTLKKAQSVYFELLGNGLPYSFNYDTRFKNKDTGAGIRAGISYLGDSNDNKFFSLPVVFNYLAGKKGKYFEVGGGITYYSSQWHDFFFSTSSSLNHSSGIVGTMIFGYRNQPVDGGFTFRAGVAPVITKDTFVPYWPYLSFGYKF